MFGSHKNTRAITLAIRFQKLFAVGTLLILGSAGIVAYQSIHIQAARMQNVRQRMLDQYTATTNWIVFAIALDAENAALAVINRITGDRKLVLSQGTFLSSPQFVADGKRLLVVRGKQTEEPSELLSCSVEDWSCRILLRSPHPIHWPVAVSDNIVLYSGGEPIGETHRQKYDFYAVKPPAEPVRLSNLDLYNLAALNVVQDTIVFSTYGSLSLSNAFFPKNEPLAIYSSEIFMLKVDWKELRIIPPSRQLERHFQIDGYSTLPRTSEDGSRVAFLNRRIGTDGSRYNLAVCTIEGKPLNYVDATSQSFSRPTFVGATVLANQIFEDRYETTLVDLANNATHRLATFNHGPRELAALAHIAIKIEND